MNIHDLPIPNFGELEDEAALKLILEVRSRRRIPIKAASSKVKSTAPRKSAKSFNTPLGNLTREQILSLLANLKG